MDSTNLNNSNIPLSELKKVIADEVNNALDVRGMIEHIPEKKGKILSRKEAAIILKVSLPTLNNYTRAGKVQAYRLGGSIRYKLQDLENSLVQIKNN